MSDFGAGVAVVSSGSLDSEIADPTHRLQRLSVFRSGTGAGAPCGAGGASSYA